MNFRQLFVGSEGCGSVLGELYSMCTVHAYRSPRQSDDDSNVTMVKSTSTSVTLPTNSQPLCPQRQQASVRTSIPSCCHTDPGEQGSTGVLARPTQPIGAALAGRHVRSDGWAGHLCLAGAGHFRFPGSVCRSPVVRRKDFHWQAIGIEYP